MSRLRALLERLHGSRRPPTGPLTTAEKATADALQGQPVLEDDKEPDTSKKIDADS